MHGATACACRIALDHHVPPLLKRLHHPPADEAGGACNHYSHLLSSIEAHNVRASLRIACRKKSAGICVLSSTLNMCPHPYERRASVSTRRSSSCAVPGSDD